MLHFSNSLRALFIAMCFSIVHISYAAHKKIGVIVPLEHESLNQITTGIKETLQDIDADIIIKNAHGDSNIMLALIKQMKDQNVDIIMPIGTSSCQMTAAHIKDKSIICVAGAKLNAHNVTGVNDEISVSYSLSKIPKLRNISVIYSASEKIAPEIEMLKKYAKEKNIVMHFAMIQNLVDMPLAVRNSPQDTEAFLILKDHLICSGLNILIQEAKKRSIPLIASDEGSVIKGATMAIGVKEKDIGVDGALLAKQVLAGGLPSSIPYKTINDLMIFVNAKSMLDQNILTKKDISELKMPITYFSSISEGK